MRLLWALFVFSVPFWIFLAGLGLFVHAAIVLADALDGPARQETLGTLGFAAGVTWIIGFAGVRWTIVATAVGVAIGTVLLVVALAWGFDLAPWIAVGVVFFIACVHRWRIARDAAVVVTA